MHEERVKVVKFMSFNLNLLPHHFVHRTFHRMTLDFFPHKVVLSKTTLAIMAVVVSQHCPLKSSLFASVNNTTDPQPKSGLSFIVDGLIISNEIHETNIKSMA